MEPSQTIGVVYLVTNRVNGKQYVGQTTRGVMDRWREHQQEASRGGYLGKAVLKYGLEAFAVTVVASATTQTELDVLEIAWIRDLQTMAPNGYNLREGGQGGRASDETRQRMREAKLGKKTGPCSDERREAISKSLKGRVPSPQCLAKARDASRRKHTPEHIERCRLALTGKKRSEGTKQNMRGWHHTEEAKEKMRAAKVGLRATPEARAKMSASHQAMWERRRREPTKE